MIEKLLNKFWYMKISKARFFIETYDNNILKWAEEDFWVKKADNHNTMETFDYYLKKSINIKENDLYKLIN